MQTSLNLPKLIALPGILLLLAGCTDDTNYDFEASRQQAAEAAALASPPQALYNPAGSVIPFPDNLLFVDSTDGTLNIPLAEGENVLSNPQFALNQLDGFSTIAPIVTGVSEPLNPETLILEQTVRIFEVTTPPTSPLAVTGSVGEITDLAEMNVSTVNNQLVLTPLTPLKPSTSYMVVLTDGIQDLEGNPLQPSFTYQLLKGEDPLTDPLASGLQQAVGSHMQVLGTQLGIVPDTVALSWVFTTQSTRDVLQAVKGNATESSLALVPVPGLSTDNENIGGRGFADIYAGSLTLPYYLTAVDENNDGTAAIESFWTNSDGNPPGALNAQGERDYTPVATSDVTVPVIMSVPNATSAGGGTMPAGGWPVTIFQHGITGNRTNMFGIADAMAQVNRVVIAIDMPLHGITDETNPLKVENERTFGIDVSTTDPETNASIPGADNITDPSGTHFIRLANLANSRDNLRQAVADLFTLTASLATASIDGLTLNTNDLSFVGHSLGGIVGTTMLSYDERFHSATLGMAGGGIAQLLASSETFRDNINAGLEAEGIETGSSDYFRFLNAAQAMVDSGDPINHASILANNGVPRIHFIEVIGDTVVPNIGTNAPLSGSGPLIKELQLQGANETVADRSAVVRFLVGDHSSLLRPNEENPEATLEMQNQTAAFADEQGATLPIGQPGLLQEP